VAFRSTNTPSTECGYADNTWTAAPVGTRKPGRWHHFEFYGKLNSDAARDGAFRLWLDGQMIEDIEPFAWMDPGCDPQSERYKWSTAFFPSNFADAPPSGSTPVYYVDDIEIWDGMP
jgi:hypothetical protein